MFFYLSKLLSFLLMPYTQMCIWFLLALLLKAKKWRKRFMILGIVYLFFFSNRFIVNEALLLWEVPPTPYAQIRTDYKAGIVLGGISNLDKEPRDRVYFYRGVDRISHALQLYKLGKIRKILVSGGSSNLINTKFKEANNLYDYLLLCGVNQNDILLENEARNTHENAIYSTGILKILYPENSRFLVITSGYHLHRALKCFRKAGLNVDGFSTDFYGKRPHFTPDWLFIPDPTAFSDWQLIIKEILGMIFYWAAGYI